jgi:cyclophilin family peptidyl-prolyl cis-trans isomerase
LKIATAQSSFARMKVVLFFFLAATTLAAAGTLAQFRTVLGDIEVELYDQDKPVTVQNFMRYVQSGLYNDSILHRCPVNPITRTSDFVVQGGGIQVADRGTTNATLDFIPSFGDIPNEFGVGRRFSNVYGTIAMAKLGGNTNSASSQWFFNLKDNSFLDTADADNLFVVFGRVVRGTNVLNQFIGRSYNNGIVNLGGVLSDLPVTYSGARVPTYDELFYVEISLLAMKARNVAGGGREISWTSVSNRLNHVEFTPGFPPNWQLLLSTNGTGGQLSVTDTAGANASRFYRVRVDY